MKNGILAAVLVALTGTVSTADDLSAVKVETGKWQAAIDAASAGGGGTVTIPEGRHVTGGLFLRDNVTLKLEKGAVLEGVPDGSRYAQVDLEFVETRSPWSALIMATNAVNVAVVGEGRLFGNGGANLRIAHLHLKRNNHVKNEVGVRCARHKAEIVNLHLRRNRPEKRYTICVLTRQIIL